MKVLIAILTVAFLTACEDGKIDKAETERTIDSAGEKIERGLERAGDSIEAKAERLEDKIEKKDRDTVPE